MEEDSLAEADAGHISANQKIFRLCSAHRHQEIGFQLELFIIWFCNLSIRETRY